MTRAIRRAAVACALAVGALLALAGPAAAHAELVSSSPSNGAVVSSEPQQVTLLFSEKLTLSLSTVKVIGPDGHRVDSGAPRAAGAEEDGLTVDLAAGAPQGTFILDWLATADDDGHSTSGVITFSVGAPSRTTAAAGFGARDRWTDAVLDLSVWLGFAGLALLVGLAAIRLHCAPRAVGGTGVAGLRWPATLGWATVLAGTLVQLFVYGPSTQGQSLAHTFDRSLLSATLATHQGHLLEARIVLLALVAAVGEVVLRRARGEVAGAVLALALAATWSGISHASSGTQVPLALVVTTLHVTAMALWAGGLFTMGVLLTREAGAELGATTARFSRLALTAVTALVVTGLYQAWREVGSLSALTGTSYGRLLLVKAGVFLLVIAVAAGTRARVARQREHGALALRRGVLLELAGVTAVLVVTVLLISNAPGRTVQQSHLTGDARGYSKAAAAARSASTTVSGSYGAGSPGR